MSRARDWSLRTVGSNDRPLIDGLMAAVQWRHAHLDWLGAGDLVGRIPFLLMSEAGRPAALLACPPDPPSVAWIRVFAGVSHLPAAEAWQAMWPTARASAVGLGAHTAAAMPADPWMESLLQQSGFAESNRVVFLEHQGTVRAPKTPTGARLRAYQPSDLQAVVEVDQRAFDGLWLYSQTVLAAALAQAASVTILETEGTIAGYQLSTASALGGHLARLAVHPEFQHRGFGRLLVEHLLHEFGRLGVDRVSVNTQQDNLPSLRLYRRLGFRDAGPTYPVFTDVLRTPAAAAQPPAGAG